MRHGLNRVLRIIAAVNHASDNGTNHALNELRVLFDRFAGGGQTAKRGVFEKVSEIDQPFEPGFERDVIGRRGEQRRLNDTFLHRGDLRLAAGNNDVRAFPDRRHLRPDREYEVNLVFEESLHGGHGIAHRDELGVESHTFVKAFFQRYEGGQKLHVGRGIGAADGFGVGTGGADETRDD
jgi:hypothetical protein